ncbi:YesL family protein [Microbacterium sp.]|uniref:YesL family protein n=1 Tax=Microbacterium sp. TaxID=51671 RepID=UPI0039E6B2DE
MRLNLFLRAVYRVAYLNLLWIATTALGLVVFGIGPASYAVAAYIDGWFRRGETPPVTAAFIGHLRTRYWHAAAMGWILLAATAIIVTNIFTGSSWLLQFANVIALVVISIIASYVFAVMAATDIRSIPRQIVAALLIGIGSLHWTIVAAAAVVGIAWLLATCALPVLVMFGVGIPAAAVGFITRIVFGQLDDAQTSPPTPRETSPAHPHLARGTSQ